MIVITLNSLLRTIDSIYSRFQRIHMQFSDYFKSFNKAHFIPKLLNLDVLMFFCFIIIITEILYTVRNEDEEFIIFWISDLLAF